MINVENLTNIELKNLYNVTLDTVAKYDNLQQAKKVGL